VPPSFYGVVSQDALTADDFARMGRGKVGTLRVPLLWPAVDPSALPGDYNWRDLDRVVAGAAGRGIRVVITVYATPGWVSQWDGCQAECAITPPRSEFGLAAWRGLLRDAVGRYGPDGAFWIANPTLPKVPVRTWQIWNEQNSPTYYAPEPSVGGYVNLLEAASGAIKGVDPGAAVILGGMFGTPLRGVPPALTAWEFLRRLYAHEGIEKRFDGVGLHPYSQSMRGVSYQVERMRKEMQRADDVHTGLWITEIGWASGGVKNSLNPGIKGQAKRLRQSFAYLTRHRRKLHIRTVDWYSWRDANSPASQCIWCPQSGLFTSALAPKPAWREFVRFTGGS
jgi:hypothetical protein